MARKLAVEIVGNAASLKAALGSASAAVGTYAAEYKTAFAEMSTATLSLSVAQDKLAISTARYGVGTTGAAAATVKYRREVEQLAAAQSAAVGRIGSMLTRGITIPTLLIGGAAAKMGIEFHKQMLMIHTDAGASTRELHMMTQEVLELAKVSPVGPTELAKGLYHLESLGLRGAKALEALRISGVAAGMTMANIEDVATALGGAVVANVKGTHDFTAAMGTVIATIGVGNMRLQELTAAFGTGLLPAAKNAGLTLQQTGAALAVLTDRGVSAENAGTRLRMTFALMQAPSDKAKRALAEMGIDADDMAKKLRGPNGLMVVLTMLHEAMRRVGATTGSSLILRAFGGGRSGAGILTLIQSLDSAVSSYQGKLNAIKQQQQAFARNQKDYMESPAYRFQVAINRLEAALIKLGGTTAPILIGMATAVATVAEAFDGLPGPVKEALGTVIALLAIGGPMMMAFAGIQKMIVTVGRAFGVMGAEAAIASAETVGSLEGVTAAAAVASTEVSILQERIAMYGVGAPAAAAQVEASMAGVAASAGGASAAVGGLRGALAAIGRMGPIAIAITIALSLVPGNKGGQALLEKAGVGWLGKAPIVGDLYQQEAAGLNWLRGKTGFRGGAIKSEQNLQMSDEEIDEANARYLKIYQESWKHYKARTGEKNKRYFNALHKSAEKWLTENMPGFMPEVKLPDIGGFGPGLKLPKSISRKGLWAQTTKTVMDDLAADREARDYWKAQLAKAPKGTDAYDEILQNYAQAASAVLSLESQIKNQAEKASRVKFKLPPSIAGAISRAQALENPQKELAAINRAIKYVKDKIAAEHNLARKALEEEKLASLVKQAAAAKKKIGDKIIEALQSNYDAAKQTDGIADDITALNKLKAGILKQIKLQKDNIQLQKKLNDVNKQFADIKKNLIDQLRETMGTLGQGPIIDPENDPLRKWQMGVRHTAQEYLQDIKKQMAEFKNLQGLIARLQKRGAPQALIDELRGQGMAAFPEVFALAHADKGTLKKFFAAYKDREQMLRVTANAIVNANNVTVVAKGAVKASGQTAEKFAERKGGTVGRPRGHHGSHGTPHGDRGDRGPSGYRVQASTPNSGYIPSQNQGGPDTVHAHLIVDGRELADIVLPLHQRKTRGNAAQRRGRHGGSSLAVH